MKRIFGLSLCLLTVFLLGACSSDDTPVANVPQLSGNITFDRTRVGVGQPVKMSFALPCVSQSGRVESRVLLSIWAV